jgi:hypothetical protein
MCWKCQTKTTLFHCAICGTETFVINVRRREAGRRILRHARWYLELMKADMYSRAILFNLETNL